MAKWLAREFDWTLGKYTGNYYNIAQVGVVSVFVDSYNGNDTNDGTPNTPFKTLSKAITVLNSTGANGSRIFMNGVFSETLPSQTYWYQFIGCGGGYGGLTVFAFNPSTGVSPKHSRADTIYENITTENYGYSNFYASAPFSAFTLRALSCLFYKVQTFRAYGQVFLGYFCVKYDCVMYGHSNGGFGPYIRGKNNSLIKTKLDAFGLPYILIEGMNQHVQESAHSLITTNSLDSIFNTDGQYIDPESKNYALQATSPLLFSGFIDGQTGIKSHVGAGIQGFKYNGLSNAFTTLGGAVLTNLEADEFGKLRRINLSENGNVISGIIDLGNGYPISKVDVNNVFEYGVSGVTMGVFDNIAAPRGVLTIKIKYGLLLSDISTCPWLKMEYGKKPTYSGLGSSRVGNGDDTFDETDEKNVNARFLQFNVSLKDISI